MHFRPLGGVINRKRRRHHSFCRHRFSVDRPLIHCVNFSCQKLFDGVKFLGYGRNNLKNAAPKWPISAHTALFERRGCSCDDHFVPDVNAKKENASGSYTSHVHERKASSAARTVAILKIKEKQLEKKNK